MILQFPSLLILLPLAILLLLLPPFLFPLLLQLHLPPLQKLLMVLITAPHTTKLLPSHPTEPVFIFSHLPIRMRVRIRVFLAVDRPSLLPLQTPYRLVHSVDLPNLTFNLTLRIAHRYAWPNNINIALTWYQPRLYQRPRGSGLLNDLLDLLRLRRTACLDWPLFLPKHPLPVELNCLIASRFNIDHLRFSLLSLPAKPNDRHCNFIRYWVGRGCQCAHRPSLQINHLPFLPMLLTSKRTHYVLLLVLSMDLALARHGLPGRQNHHFNRIILVHHLQTFSR